MLETMVLTAYFRFILFLILIFLVINTAGGVIYSILRDDISTGLTISTYAIGIFILATAIWGAGEHLGVEKPDSRSYSFDTVYGSGVTQDGREVKGFDIEKD
jgi:hypothetical protein